MYAYLDKSRNLLALTQEEIGGTTGWEATTQEALTAKTGKTVEQMTQQLSDVRGIPLYRMKDGYAVPRTQEEMDADYKAPVASPTLEKRVEDVETSTAALEEQIDMLLTGATEDA